MNVNLTRIKKTLNMIIWLNFFGAGSMLSSSFVWGLFQAVQESKGSINATIFLLAAFGIITFAGTLYSAFRAFYVFATDQKSEWEED